MKRSTIKTICSLMICFMSMTFVEEAWAKTKFLEKEYAQKWCQAVNGRSEVTVDNLRIDCLTEDVAVEFDFASKWAEGVGQSIKYSQITGKKAGLVLIVENKKEMSHVKKATDLFENLPCIGVKVWIMLPSDLKLKEPSTLVLDTTNGEWE